MDKLNTNEDVSALSAMGSVLVEQGKLDDAEKTYARALKLSMGYRGQPLPVASSTYAGLARLHLVRKDLESARNFAHTGISLGEKWENADSQVGSYLALAQAEHLDGNSAEARSTLDQAKRLAATHNLWPGRSITSIDEKPLGHCWY